MDKKEIRKSVLEFLEQFGEEDMAAMDSILVRELMGSPAKLMSFIKAHGAMGVWFCFRIMEKNCDNVRDLDKKIAQLNIARRDHEAMLEKLKNKVVTQGKAIANLKSGKPLLD